MGVRPIGLTRRAPPAVRLRDLARAADRIHPPSLRRGRAAGDEADRVPHQPGPRRDRRRGRAHSARLTEGWIAGAGLDVFAEEPGPDGHPLYGLDNVVCTAHIGGWVVEAVPRLSAVMAREMLTVLRGRAPVARGEPRGPHDVVCSTCPDRSSETPSAASKTPASSSARADSSTTCRSTARCTSPFVRSPFAHAAHRLDRRRRRARRCPASSPCSPPPTSASPPYEGLMHAATQLCARPPLADGKVRFVGDRVAVVVAETRAPAVDAAEAVIVDYDPLPGRRRSRRPRSRPDAPLQFEALGSNLAAASPRGRRRRRARRRRRRRAGPHREPAHRGHADGGQRDRGRARRRRRPARPHRVRLARRCRTGSLERDRADVRPRPGRGARGRAARRRRVRRQARPRGRALRRRRAPRCGCSGR